MSLECIIKTSLNCKKGLKLDKDIKKVDIIINKINISQHELMNSIHQEFQMSFIQKLYPHIEWTERIFWNVAGTLQQKYYEDLSLDEIITAIKRYLTDHKMIVPRS